MRGGSVERPQDLLGGPDAVDLRHADVHQHDVGPQLPHDGDRLRARRRLADDLHVRLGGQDRAQGGAHHALVVGEHHCCRSFTGIGRHARSLQERPRRESHVSASRRRWRRSPGAAICRVPPGCLAAVPALASPRRGRGPSTAGVPPRRRARSAMPRRPWPPPGRARWWRCQRILAVIVQVRRRPGRSARVTRRRARVPQGVAQALLDDAVGLAGRPSGGRARGPSGPARRWRSPAGRPRGAAQQAVEVGGRGWGPGAVGLARSPPPSRSTPSTASSSPTVRRVVSSIAASASRTNSGSRSRTRRAALACRVTALSAWPDRVVQLAREAVAHGEVRGAALGRGQPVGRRRARAARAPSGRAAPPGHRRARRERHEARPPRRPGERASAQGSPRTSGIPSRLSRSAGDERQRDQHHRERRQRQRHPADDPAEPEVQREPGAPVRPRACPRTARAPRRAASARHVAQRAARRPPTCGRVSGKSAVIGGERQPDGERDRSWEVSESPNTFSCADAAARR